MMVNGERIGRNKREAWVRAIERPGEAKGDPHRTRGGQEAQRASRLGLKTVEVMKTAG